MQFWLSYKATLSRLWWITRSWHLFPRNQNRRLWM